MLKIRCSLLPNPVQYCDPELDWEKVEEKTCLDTKTGEDVTFSQNKSGNTSSVSCKVSHFVGVSPNDKIKNLKSILGAYQPVNLERETTKLFIRDKLFSQKFMNNWQNEYKLKMGDYNKTVRDRPLETFMKLTNEIYLGNFRNVDYDEPEYCRIIRKDEELLKYDFNVKQLVGFCSIYKIYFPLFRSEFHRYFERKIDGIRTRVIFPSVDASINIDDILERKLGHRHGAY